MKKICLNIEVHQPMKLQTFKFYEILNNHNYYDDHENEYNLRKISEQYYLPANKILLDLIHYYKSSFEMSFLFSGVVLDQFELYAPEMLDNYKALLSTGQVHLLSGTYSNMFGPITNNIQYYNQIKLQKERVISLFGKEPVIFPDRNLQYSVAGNPVIRILSGDSKLNEVISLEFSSKDPCELINNQDKLIKRLNGFGQNNCVVDIFIPYVAGGCQNANIWLLEFLESFPSMVLTKSDFTFANPSEIRDYLLPSFSADLMGSKNFQINGSFFKSCSEMQIDAFEKLCSFSDKIEKCSDPLIKIDWLYLQTCDHFYFMDPALYEDRELYGFFIPYDSPYFAYINYMNVLMDFSDRLEKWFVDCHKDQKNIYDKIA